MVASWRDVCQHIGVGLKPSLHGQGSRSKCMCLSLSWSVVSEFIEVTGFMGGGGLPAVKCQVCFQWDCTSGPLC